MFTGLKNRSSGREPALTFIVPPDSWILDFGLTPSIKSICPCLSVPVYVSQPLPGCWEVKAGKSRLRQVKVAILRKKRLFIFCEHAQSPTTVEPRLRLGLWLSPAAFKCADQSARGLAHSKTLRLFDRFRVI
jgi:hypothetical protein